MRRERINLVYEFGLRRHRRWRTGTLNGASERKISLGETADGRWWVNDTKDSRGARLCRDERDAYDVADYLMARSGQTWTRVPAEFDGWGNPVEPGWCVSGQRWYRTDEEFDGLPDTRRHGEGS